jgi:hypothetical protein
VAAKILPAGADIAAPTSRNNGCGPLSMALHAGQIAPDLLDVSTISRLTPPSLPLRACSTTFLTIARTRCSTRQFLPYGQQNLHLLASASHDGRGSKSSLLIRLRRPVAVLDERSWFVRGLEVELVLFVHAGQGDIQRQATVNSLDRADFPPEAFPDAGIR